MKKAISLVLTLCLLMMTTAFGVAETADGSAEALELMENVKGTYEPLFPVITAPEYDQIWKDPCVKALGEEAGAAMAEMMQNYCTGTIYGQEAVDAFGDGSNGMQFACGFINGVATITFDGLTISGADESGKTVFSHEYAYVSKLSMSGMMEGYLFETADEDAGEFPLRQQRGRPGENAGRSLRLLAGSRFPGGRGRGNDQQGHHPVLRREPDGRPGGRRSLSDNP